MNSANTIIDGWASFPAGMDAGIEPQLLQKDQAANITNGTVRGSFVTNRPPYQNQNISYTGDFDGTGVFQGACRYVPDNGGLEYIVAAIGGNLFKFDVAGTGAVTNISNGVLLPAFTAQNWLWQSENYLINNDGSSIPRIFDGVNTRQANVATLIATSAGSSSTSIPAVGQTFVLPISAPYTGPVNIPVRIFQGSNSLGNFEILSPGSTGSSFGVLLTNINDTGGVEPAGSAIQIINTYVSTVTKKTTLAAAGNHNIPVAAFYNGAVGDTVQVKGTVVESLTPATLNLKISTISADGLTLTVNYSAQFTFSISLGATVTKQNAAAPTTLGYLAGDISIPQGQTQNVAITQAYTGPSQTVYINNSQYTIAQATSTGQNSLTLLNMTAATGSISAGASVNTLFEIPPGCMGAYVQGRNWIVMPDRQSYIATDQVGDSSGTAALFYRDAVLQVTQNTLLSLGGSFRVPGGAGLITGIIDAATLDASLGQGPIQILTPKKVFSCAAPTIQDRAQWVSVTDPIQTESLITNGGLSQDSLLVANGDIFMRSIDGWRSLILARREFATWGNTPQSDEVRPFLFSDDQSLLQFSQAVQFDNRILLANSPAVGSAGVYWRSMVVMNFDEISSLRGKAPSVWEGQWNGLNVLKFVAEQFNGVSRCFAFCYNTTTSLIELWEILPSELPAGTIPKDNQNTSIAMSFETPILLDTIPPKKSHNTLCQLTDGEIYLKDLMDDVTVKVSFRPDYSEAYFTWTQFTIPKGATYQPRFGFGKPPTDSDPSTKRPWAQGYAFQLKVEITTGHAICMGGRVQAEVLPTPSFAPIMVNS